MQRYSDCGWHQLQTLSPASLLGKADWFQSVKLGDKMTKRDDSSRDASFKEIRELLSDSDAVKRQRGAALAYIKYLPYVTSKLGLSADGFYRHGSPVLFAGNSRTDVRSEVFTNLLTRASKSPLTFDDVAVQGGTIVTGESRLKSYLVTIGENLVNEFLRRQSSEKKSNRKFEDESGDAIAPSTDSPSQFVHRDEVRYRLQQALALLTERQRDHLKANTEDELTWQEIARRELKLAGNENPSAECVSRYAHAFRVAVKRGVQSVREQLPTEIDN